MTKLAFELESKFVSNFNYQDFSHLLLLYSKLVSN